MLYFTGLLLGIETFGHAPGALAGAPVHDEEQDDGECERPVAERRASPAAAGDAGEESADHRRPRFQSSNRA